MNWNGSQSEPDTRTSLVTTTSDLKNPIKNLKVSTAKILFNVINSTTQFISPLLRPRVLPWWRRRNGGSLQFNPCGCGQRASSKYHISPLQVQATLVWCRREKRHLTRLRRVMTGQQLKTATRSYLRFLRSKSFAYYTERICEVHHPERRWKLIKEASGLGRNPQRSVTPSPKDYSSYLNDKLRGICESTAGAPPPGFSTLIDIELNQLHPTSVDEVVMLIHSLPNKQCGLDPIPTWLLKKLSLVLAPFLVRLFNSSLSTGYVPSSFKIAQVRPMIKKATLDPHQSSSYRPISNLSVISKLLERLVLRRLVNYLNCNALLPATQSAYRRHHSTETAVLKVVSDIRSAVDLGSVSLLLLLDMSAAFDTVDTWDTSKQIGKIIRSTSGGTWMGQILPHW